LRRVVAVAAAVVLTTGCDNGPRTGAPDAATSYRATATIEEVMRHMIDPAADAIWESVVTEVTAAGVVEHAPATDEEWATLRGQAITLMEAADLLIMPGRRVAAPGSRSELPGVDLEPEEIEALLATDRAGWASFAAGLHASGATALEAIDRRDVDALLVSGDGLDLACENCHIRYWYPSLAEKDTAR
jgi:hypothetical protein